MVNNSNYQLLNILKFWTHHIECQSSEVSRKSGGGGGGGGEGGVMLPNHLGGRDQHAFYLLYKI